MRGAAGLALLLAACSSHASDAPAAGGETIDCAIGGAVDFSHDCTVEHSAQNGDPVLIVRDPAGGFRRFTVFDGGRSLGAADGAQALAVANDGKRVDVDVNGDRYRFSANMLSDAARR
jgi:CTP:molybdopterin cytidylyltransferase MocA